LRQLQYCNFWAGAEANRGAGGSDAAVDVELPAGFFVPSADVGGFRAYKGEAPIDERESQLAAVAVPGQGQVNTQLGGTIEAVGVVAQKDVEHARHHQFFASREIPVNEVPVMIPGESPLLVVNTDQVRPFAVRLNECPLLTQDANPHRGEESNDGILGFSMDLMVAEATENTIGRTKARERLDHFSLRGSIVGDVVAGQRHHVGFQPVGDCDATANLVRSHEGADVKVGKLDDAKALKGFG